MSKKCQKCSSERVLHITGKCSDCCGYSLGDHVDDGDGYVPSGMGVGGGDYLEFNFCLDCGQIQGTWPRPKTEFEQEIEAREQAPFKRGEFVEFDYRNLLIVGEVDGYDADNCEVKVLAHGAWDEDNNCLGRMPARSGPHHNSRVYTIDQDDLRKTNKEW